MANALITLITTPVAIFHCPSRRQVQLYTNYNGEYNSGFASNVVRTDYAGNGGDNNITDSTQCGQPSSLLRKAIKREHTGPVFPLKQASAWPIRMLCPMGTITDGASNTYLIGEKYLGPDNYFNGEDLGDNEDTYTGLNFDNVRTSALSVSGSTYNYQPPLNDTPGNDNYFAFGSAHPGTFYMSFCDGSVHAMSISIDPETHRRLANRADGLLIDASKF